jgi:hypothetical protein
MSYIKLELRRQVIERAGGCCEYCLLSQRNRPHSFHIEHIIAERHRGKTELKNLCLSCPRCNTLKGTDLASLDPKDDKLTLLYNPRTQRWSEHFRLNGILIEPLTPEGRVTVFLLNLNSPQRLKERSLLLRLEQYPCQSPA